MAIFNSKLLDYVSSPEGIVDPLLILVGGLEYIYIFFDDFPIILGMK